MAFNFNPDNNGTVLGRLARDPKIFTNSDGSKSVNFVVMADRGYKDDQGKDVADAVPVTAFVRSQTDINVTPFVNIHKGDLVRVNTTIRVGKPYQKNGETIYPGPEIAVEYIKNLEPKSVTQGRLAERLRKAEQENQNLQGQGQQEKAPAAQPAAAAASTAPAQAAENSYDDPPF